MVRQVNQADILAWWPEVYQEPEWRVPADSEKLEAENYAGKLGSRAACQREFAHLSGEGRFLLQCREWPADQSLSVP
ncbi:MAG: hypothetical protein ACYCRE_03600 [Acidobacteriaceae bacterium]